MYKHYGYKLKVFEGCSIESFLKTWVWDAGFMVLGFGVQRVKRVMSDYFEIMVILGS